MSVFAASPPVSLDALLRHPHPLWRGSTPPRNAHAVPSGYRELDAELGGGWPAAGLAELLAAHEGIGEVQLVMPALAALTGAGKRVVWLAPPHLPYAPALAAEGIDLAHLVVVRAPGRRDALWAAEQALRSGSCRALVGWFRRARFEELRRLAVAAEAGNAFAALFRPPEAAHEPSPASLRLALAPAEEGGLSVRILKRRGAPAAAPLLLQVKRPVHALARAPFSRAAAGGARDARRLGVPVHA